MLALIEVSGGMNSASSASPMPSPEPCMRISPPTGPCYGLWLARLAIAADSVRLLPNANVGGKEPVSGFE